MERESGQGEGSASQKGLVRHKATSSGIRIYIWGPARGHINRKCMYITELAEVEPPDICRSAGAGNAPSSHPCRYAVRIESRNVKIVLL